MEYLERNAAQARVNGHYVKTGNITAAAYDHVSSRAGDPQKHTHVLIANVTFDKDGNARSVSNEKLLEYRKSADAIYHQELSRQLQALGYSVRHDRQGHVELADYTKEQLADFSTRSKEIEGALATRGLTRETASA
ncbi:Conjugal protein, TraA, partial [mine drainage metagenome]